MANLVDFILEEDYARYQELVAKATENKKNAPKPKRKPRGPLTNEQKIKMMEGRKAKLEAQLAALMAGQPEIAE